MSLKVFVLEDLLNKQEVSIVKDIEVEFLKVHLSGSNLEVKALKEIEKGEYLDNLSFIDRFGYKLYLRFLSGGCKCALCVIQEPNKIISLLECGDNAIDFILQNCSSGSVAISKERFPLCLSEGKTDFIFNGKHFDSTLSFTKFIESEWV